MKQKWKKIGLGCFMLALVILAGVSIWLAVMKNRTTETNEKETAKKNKLDVEWYDENGKEFTITTADQLFEFSKLSTFYNFRGQTIKLGADIVVNEGNAADWENQIPERMWDGIGGFAGTFDGQGHTISGICCYGQLYSAMYRTKVDYYTAGLFRFTDKDCVIKNFKLVNSYFKNDVQYGAAAISSCGAGTFESIYTDAIVVSCRNFTGGILGRTRSDGDATIRNCWFDGEIRVEGNWGRYIGGIVGRVQEDDTCTIEHCLNTGVVSSDLTNKGIQLGGLVGYCKQGTVKISDSLAAGELKNEWGNIMGSVMGNVSTDSRVTMTDVYSIEECWKRSVGYVAGKLTGYPVTYAEETLKGMGGYEWTTLDFEKYWAAVPDEIPVLKTFAKDTLSCEGIERKVDISWYDKDESTYVLEDEADFYGFSILSASTNFEGKTVKLAANLTLNKGNAANWAKQAPENKWMPIGSSNIEFQGTFDGQKHTISGIYLKISKTDESYRGLFGVIGEKGKVKNFSLKNSYFETCAASFGSIAGRCRGTIDTVYSDAIVVSNEGVNVGGFIGQVPGKGNVSLNNCWFAGTVTNKANDKDKRGVGGFIGSNLSDSKMTNCLFTGTVDASAYNSRHSETNKHISPRAGGFVGTIGNKSKMDISYSLSTGTIKVNQAATAGFGPIIGSSGSMATLSNLYASDACKKVDIGTVKGAVTVYDQSKLNGYAGYQWTTLDFNKYWAVVVGPDKAPVLKSFAGKVPSVAGITRLMDISWYNAKNDVYVLNDLADLNGFALLSRETNFTGKTIKLGADIVANTGNAADWANAAPAYSWMKIGYSKSGDDHYRFNGTFDGQGHTISGLYLKADEAYIGFFGLTDSDAVVKNFKLKNSYFENTARGVGSIAGSGKGTFDTIYSDAIIVGKNASVGGLLGQDATGGMHMRNCWFAGSVINNQTDNMKGNGTGGLIGNLQNQSVVTNCLNTGTVTAKLYNKAPRVGGLIGAVLHKDAKISYCVNAGQLVGGAAEYPKGGYGAFAGHVVGTKMFNNSYAVRECCNAFASGYNDIIDRTTSKLVSEKDAMGMASIVNMRALFRDQNDWSIVLGGNPILKSFGEESSQKIINMKADTSWYDEKKDTYVLKDAADLYGLAVLSRETNFAGKTIKLGADIVVNTGNAADWAVKAPELDWIKIGYNKSGDDNYRFNGTFDGQGHTISGIYSKSSDSYTGLFGLTESNAVIKDFSLTNSYFESSARGVGSIAGSGRGTFDTIYSDAIVVGKGASVGGLLGQDAGGGVSVNNCWFAGTVTNIETDSANGNGTGGLIGNLQNASKVANCLNTGTITAENYNKAARVGGLIGAVSNEDAKISHCVNAGKVICNLKNGYGAFAGHVVGENMFNHSYAIQECCGAFAAGYTSMIDRTTSKLVSQENATGKDAIINMPALFYYQSEDGNYESYWVEKENEIPALKSFAEAAKSSVDVSWYDTEKTEYVLKDVADLYGFALLSQSTNFADKIVKLGADIVVNEGNAADWATTAPVYDWPGIGTDAEIRFNGTFDGDGHTISGLYVKTATNYRGMFGYTETNAVIKNFSLKNSYFESSARGVGSIAGSGKGTFDTIYSDAIVIGKNASVGGLLGQDAGGGVRMNNCWFAGTVTNNQTGVGNDTGNGTGGLIGNLNDGNKSVIMNCLNTGTITADQYEKQARVGGLIGAVSDKEAKISHCVNAGKVVCNLTSGYGAFAGRIVGTNMFNNSYAIKEACGDLTKGDSAALDKTTSKVVAQADAVGLKAVANMPVLFCYETEDGKYQSYWIARADGTPVLASFAETKTSAVDISWYDAQKKEYVLKDVADFYGFAILSQKTNFAGETVKLGADIVVNEGKAADWGATAPAYSWPGIGADANVRFNGTFDGDGHKISGLYLKTATTYQGMFGNTADKAVVKNFRLENSYFESSAKGIGSIAGRGLGTFDTIYSDAIVVGKAASVGGLLGQGATGAVKMNNCWFAGTVTNNQTGVGNTTGNGTGGLVGNLNDTTKAVITNCLNTGIITANQYEKQARVGGLIGAVIDKDTKISHCVNAGKVICNLTSGYGAFAGHIENGGTNMFNHSYAVKEGCGSFAAGYTTMIDRTTSKLVAQADATGEKALTSMPSLFTENDYWVTVSEGIPVLKSFEKK